MAYDTTTARRMAEAVLRTNPPRTETPISTGIPFWDMMLSFGKASQQALTSYGVTADRAVQSDRAVHSTQAVHHVGSDVEVIPVGEETLHVGTRQISGETTRIRRVVVETPVEQSVSLREERVIVERRAPTGATVTATQGILTDTAVEMSDSYEVVEVWKSARITEEVVLRREVTERTETVRDIVRRDEVVVEQARPKLAAPRPQAEVVQQDRPTPAPQASQPAPAPQPAHTPDPAKLSADLKKVAERFEADASQPNKAPAPAKAEAPKATAEAPKVPTPGARNDVNNEQNDKNVGRKN